MGLITRNIFFKTMRAAYQLMNQIEQISAIKHIRTKQIIKLQIYKDKNVSK